MGNDPFNIDEMVSSKSVAEQFREDRLDREGLAKSQWPAQIDRAALDIQYGIAIGKTDDKFDIGGTIDQFNFDRATGSFYVEGLQALTGEESSAARSLDQYDSKKIGQLAYQLSALRRKLGETGQSMDIDRALAAFMEKQAASAIGASAKKDRNAGAGLRRLRDTSSAADLAVKLFSDPRIDKYAQALMANLPDQNTESEELLRVLDGPRMTTPLWTHQRRAMTEWIDHNQQGYVDMATATGKTVLGLAAIAYRYGELHPADNEITENPKQRRAPPDRTPHVLIVAGNEVLLKQWRDEFDEHLDIPKSRTQPLDTAENATIELDWGVIDFRTAPALIGEEDFSRYDLTILDEAHSYTRGSQSGGAWGDLFATITAQSDAVLAMSGSVDGGWAGDEGARDALEEHLERCIRFGVPEARDQGVIADFSWEVHYAPADPDDEHSLATHTRVTKHNYDARTGRLDIDALNVPPDDDPGEFAIYGDIRSFVQSNVGNDLRGRSNAFDMFASAILARRPSRWNTSPKLETIQALVDRHAPTQKTVVLVQSYEESRQLGGMLKSVDGFDGDNVVILENGEDDRHARITDFNELSEGVIVGPGDLLGVGVNMPDAEVAVNVSRGGVNASLVQRIGRVLRNPSGEKEAKFYHVVPQATMDDAVDWIEDGAQLLRHAAEFRVLGETFKEQPAYTTASSDLSSALVRLEGDGVDLLDRIEDASVLVDGEEPRKRLRELQATIYDAVEAEGGSSTDPVLTTVWSSDSGDEVGGAGGDDAHQGQFPERHDRYEQYRLALGPYRTMKALATTVYDLDIAVNQSGDEWMLSLSDHEDTEFHAEFERWLNEYRTLREECDNKDGTGEPGSLPTYKEAWPAPRDEDGTMVTPEAAGSIGVDYARDDPLFLPKLEGEIYELPLPDGRVFTVEGIVDPEDEPDKSKSASEDTFEVSRFVLAVARHAIDDGDGPDTLEELVTEGVNDLLKASLDGATVPAPPDDSSLTAAVAVDLEEKILRMIDVIVNDPSEPCSSRNKLVEAALRNYLDIGSGNDEPVSVSFSGETLTMLEWVVDDSGNYTTVSEFVENVVEEDLEDRI